MRGSELVEAMASAVDQIVSVREGTSAVDRAIEVIVSTIRRFGGKNTMSYLEAYRAEMVMRDIPEERQLAGFPRVARPGIHAEVPEVQAGCRTWEEFEGRLLEKYGHDDALRFIEGGLHGVGGGPRKGEERVRLLWEFEELFARLSALDRTVLDTSRVLLFVKVVDVRDREQVGLLLETDDGPTED